MNDEKPLWLKIDNAGKIYPGTNNSRWNCVYRLSVVLKQRIDPEVLQEALNTTIERYPHFNVSLKKGVFWFYLHYLDMPVPVEKESNYPCQRFELNGSNVLFRLLYSKYRISIEVFHSVADGFGAVNFMNTLLLKYFHIQGKKVGQDYIRHYDDTPIDEEYEDSYLKYYDPSFGKSKKKEASAYHLVANKELDTVVNIYQAEVDSNALHDVAKAYNVTINELLIGMSAYVAYKIKLTDSRLKQRKKPVKVQFAINLRNFLPSVSLRNFSGIGIAVLKEEAHEMTFEEVLASTAESSRAQTTSESIRKFINANCGLEKNYVVKIIPLFLKSLIMKAALYQVGENIITLQVSNLGVIKTPEEFKDYVDRYEFVIGRQKYNNYSITLATFNNRSVFSVTNVVKTRRFEREMCRLMASLGLDVTVNYNRGK